MRLDDRCRTPAISAGMLLRISACWETLCPVDRQMEPKGITMKTQSKMLGLFLPADAHEDLLALEGPGVLTEAAMILDDCLGDTDLTDHKHVGTQIYIEGVDFTFLVPNSAAGEFLSIPSLIEACEGGTSVRDEPTLGIRRRYDSLMEATGALLADLQRNADFRKSAAA